MSGSASFIDPVLAEQTKLTAALLNTIAAGCVVAGIITPLVGIALGALQVTFHGAIGRGVLHFALRQRHPTLDSQADP